jgi:CubicO group peptidase (beta-lactamase class C family)
VISLNQVTNSLLAPDFVRQDEMFDRAFAVLQAGIEQKAFPGASVAVAHRGRLIALKGLGRFTYDAKAPMVTPQTVYDLASLSKVLATTTTCMILHERGALALDKKVTEVLPEFGGSDQRRSQVTFRMLLAHSSGLPAYVKLFETASNRAELLAQALQVPLTGDPGSHAAYSDIGFILLGAALERITGEPLAAFCEREIFSRLRVSFATYCPPFAWMPLIPPSEDDRGFRHCVVRGRVHDENAWVMGGVAGHAGCFGDAASVATFGQCMLNSGTPLLQAHTVGLFTRRESSPAGTSRALGWDTPSPPSQSGRYFSAHSYGHLGYTGTSLWNDPERQLSVTLLTNRTWPDRSSQAIKQIRPAFHDAVVEAIG